MYKKFVNYKFNKLNLNWMIKISIKKWERRVCIYLIR